MWLWFLAAYAQRGCRLRARGDAVAEPPVTFAGLLRKLRLEEAHGIYRDLGDLLGQANALTELGAAWLQTRDFPAAAQALEEAQGIYRDLGHRLGEVEALNEAGTAYRVGGDIGRATGCHRQALDLARAIASSWDEAHALAGLGRCARADGRVADAEDSLRQALEIFQRLGAAEAAGVAVELDALMEPGPAAERQ